jgi:hypothetical protein
VGKIQNLQAIEQRAVVGLHSVPHKADALFAAKTVRPDPTMSAIVCEMTVREHSWSFTAAQP